MPEINDKPYIDETSKELSRLTRRADHLSDFGTLTSLVSTAAYFIEQKMMKKLHPIINNLTLGAVGIGILSVLASYYYKLKAGNIALHTTAHIENELSDTSVKKVVAGSDIPKVLMDSDGSGKHGKSWTARENAAVAGPAQVQR